MKNKLSVVIFLLLVLSGSILSFLFGDNLSDRRVIIVHGIRQNSQDMEPMRDELIKMGIPKENIELIDLPKNQGLIEKNAQYLGNYIKDTFEKSGRKKAIVIGYSMGGLTADFLTKNQEENVTYSYKKLLTNVEIPVLPGSIKFPIAENVTRTIKMPIHMERYINEVVLIASGPSKLALIPYDKSLENEDWAVYQQLVPESEFLKGLNDMNSNPLVVYNTISGTDTKFTKKDDDVVSNIYSQREYARNNYPIEGATHTEIYKNLDAIKLAFNEITNGALSNKEIQIRLEVKKDQLTLQRNIKRNTLVGVLKNAPCGAKTTEIIIMQDEINSIDQQIGEIETQLNSY
jgi:hypothetical protein